jgi:hypothetical protein
VAFALGAAAGTHSGALTVRGRGSRFEDEAFDGDVGFEVVGAHERDYVTAGELLDASDEVGAHRLLLGPAHLEHEFCAVVDDEALFAFAECVAQND